MRGKVIKLCTVCQKTILAEPVSVTAHTTDQHKSLPASNDIDRSLPKGISRFGKEPQLKGLCGEKEKSDN